MIPIKNTILETIAAIKPNRVLDIGCGCGSFTAELAKFCRHITAIDISSTMIERCVRERSIQTVAFQRMDAIQLSFPDNSSDFVIERASLHHMDNWQAALAEMIRVSWKCVLVKEPIDDLRSDAKRRTCQAQKLYLEVQREVGCSHYGHLGPDELSDFSRNAGLQFQSMITRSDQETSFEECFETFAHRSLRPSYWMDRLAAFKEVLPVTTLCENNTLLLVVETGKPLQVP